MRSHRRYLFLLGLVAACVAGAACGDSRSRQSASTALSPVSPTPLASGSRSGGPAATGPAAASALPGGGGNEGRSVSLPPEAASGMLDVAFPGRNESFVFRQTLEAKYGMGCAARPRRAMSTSRATSSGRRSICAIASTPAVTGTRSSAS